MIPTYIIEEHHEAFIVWHDAMKRKWIPLSGNVLYHVDEHSDMSVPMFNQSILQIDSSSTMEEISRFTYSELCIASFIVPFCYLGHVGKLYWIKQDHRNPKIRPVKMWVRSFNQEGKKLFFTKAVKENNDAMYKDKDKKTIDYHLIMENQMPPAKKVILDIDLDYFSCVGDPTVMKEIYVEITKSEYDNLNNNKYHPLNFLGIRKIETEAKDNKYYLVINNYREIYPCKQYMTLAEIDARIDRFVQALAYKRIKPLIIDICRSRFSGYTPADQWEYIEKKLLTGLDNLYGLDFIPWQRP